MMRLRAGRNRCRRPADGADDTVVSATAADIALQRPADLFVVRMRVIPQQSDGRNDHSGGAVAALQGVGVDKRLLNGVQTAGVFEAFDGGYALAGRCFGGGQARAPCNAVDQHGACATLAFAASVLRASE